MEIVEKNLDDTFKFLVDKYENSDKRKKLIGESKAKKTQEDSKAEAMEEKPEVESKEQ